MAIAKFLNLSLAKQIGGDNYDKFLSAIAFDTNNGYYYYNLEFSIRSDYLNITKPKIDIGYRRKIFESIFGDIDNLPEVLDFNFECKCFAENNGFELMVLKPWCTNSNLAHELIRTVETYFFLCIEIRLFLAILRRAINLERIDRSDIFITRAIKDIDQSKLYTFSLGHNDSLNNLSFYLDSNIEVLFDNHLSSLTYETLSQTLLSQNIKYSSISLSNSSIIYRSQFTFKIYKYKVFVGYIILTYKDIKNSSYNFCKGFFIDYVFTNGGHLGLFLDICKGLAKFLGKYTTSIMLYFNNSAMNFDDDIINQLGLVMIGYNVYGLFIAEEYYSDIQHEYDTTKFSNLILYSDPNEHPRLG